jgi:hypothetical protein
MLADMKSRHNMMWLLAVAALGLGFFPVGCGKPAQRNPSLTEVPSDPAKPAEKGFLTKAGDTTWNVVTAPVRWVTPKKPVAPQEPEVFEPAPLIIVRPGSNRVMPPAPEEARGEPVAVPATVTTTAPAN